MKETQIQKENLGQQTLDGLSLGFGAAVVNAVSRQIDRDRATWLLHSPDSMKLRVAPLLHDDFIDLLPALAVASRRRVHDEQGRIAWFDYRDAAFTKNTFNRPSLLAEAERRNLAFLTRGRAQELAELTLRFNPEVNCYFVYCQNGAVNAITVCDGRMEEENIGRPVNFKGKDLDQWRAVPCASWTVFFFKEEKVDRSDHIFAQHFVG